LPAADENHSPSGRLTYLDGWRAVATAFVLFDHFGSSRYFNTGIVGVEFFFVLSGRLMAQMLFVERMPLGTFYFRRFSRVWPSLACLIGVLLVLSRFVPSLGVGLPQALFALTFTFNYAVQFGFSTQPIDHVWSLCIEEHSYLFLGLLAAFTGDKPRTRWTILLVAIALCVADGAVSTFVFKEDYVQTYWRSDVRIASVLLGAACFLGVGNGRLRLGGWVVPALLVVGIALNVKFAPDPLKYSLGTLCLALFVSNIERAPAQIRTMLSWTPLVWIGLISYSLYLWQQPFAFDLSRAIVPRTAHFVLAVLAGIAGFYFVERRSRRWLNSRPPPWARGASTRSG
jgi:peptidoglycan/LPS O-acetylase OafA/YrhL